MNCNRNRNESRAPARPGRLPNPGKLVQRILFIVGVMILSRAVLVLAQQVTTPREQLKQYVADLQRHPSDNQLRERIIKLALTLDPQPAIPDDAAIAAAKGKTIFAHAAESGSKDDVKAAADAFANASLVAPWVADYYFNEGLALEKAGQPDDAIQAFHFYLLAKPSAADANEVRGRIEGINYEKVNSQKQTHTAFDKAITNLLGGNSARVRFLGAHRGNLEFAIRVPEGGSTYIEYVGQVDYAKKYCPASTNLVANQYYSIQFTQGGDGSIHLPDGKDCSLNNFGMSPYVPVECLATKPYLYMAGDGSLSCGVEQDASELTASVQQPQERASLAGKWDCQSGCESATVSVNGSSFSAEITADMTAPNACAYNESGECGSILRLTVSGSVNGNDISGTITLPRMHTTSTNCEIPADSESLAGAVSAEGKTLSLNFNIQNWHGDAQRTILGLKCTGVSSLGQIPKSIVLGR